MLARPHSVVFAQMIVNKKHYGVKSFLVQLRDPVTFDLKPGVSIGDCGAKMVPSGHPAARAQSDRRLIR